MDVTPKELRDTDIGDAFRGYNRDQVDELLDRAAATIERLQESSRQLSERVASAESDVGRGRETEDMLHRTLLLAQRTADEAVAEARARSAQMVEEAEARSRSLLSEAESSARRVADAEQKRLSGEVHDLSTRRDALRRDVDALELYATEYRTRLRGMIEDDLEALNSEAATTTFPSRPPLRSADTAPASAPSAPVSPPPAAESWTAPPAPAYPPPAPSEVSAVGSTDDVASERAEATVTLDRDAPSYPPPGQPRAVDGGDAANGGGSFPGEGTTPLDDDAFFASLRDAVRDETPLGSESGTGEVRLDQDEVNLGASTTKDDAGSGLFRRRR